MRFFALTFDKVLLRFFLMMACVIFALFTGQALLALVALPIFLSALLGVSFLPEKREQTEDSQVVTMNRASAQSTQAA